MKKISYLTIFFITLFLQSCNLFKDDCKDIQCFTPPETFSFQLVNPEGKDALSDSAFILSKLEVIRLEHNENLKFDTASVQGITVLTVERIGWEEGVESYQFVYNEAELFTFTLDAETVSENCCTFTRYNEISVLNAEYTIVTEAQLDKHYKISVSY